MYQQRTGLILFVAVVFGTILQLIGLITPDWIVSSSTLSEISSSYGLWFYRTCESNGECETTTYYELYTKALDEDPKSSEGNA